MRQKTNDQLIVIEEYFFKDRMKMNLLAKSCISPGIISLLGNLVKSSGDTMNQ